MVNGHVTSLLSIFYFTHKMTYEQLVMNCFIVDADRNIMEYRRIIPKDLSHVKREQHIRQKMDRFMKLVGKYYRAENWWIETSSNVKDQKVNRMWQKV